jgi:polysaccharide deacetylase 2 family uncharacterized protein YibQ
LGEKEGEHVLSNKAISPLPNESRLIILFYLVFLALLLILQSQFGGEQAVPAFTMSDYGDHEQSLYRLQDWQAEMDRRMNTFFRKHSVDVTETTWILRENTAEQPPRWSTTEFHLQWDEENTMKELTTFQKELTEEVAQLGGARFFADLCKLNGVTYYRFDYGITWGKRRLVTHRLYIKKPERAAGKTEKLGLTLKARPQPVTPQPELKKIGLIPKPQLIPTIEPKQQTGLDKGAKEVTAGLHRSEARHDSALTRQRPRVAIIIDDFGFVKEPAEAYFRIRAPLTIAVLPHGEYSKEHARQAAQAGFEVLLHQPLEPLNMGRNNPGPGFITGREPEERIREMFAANLAEVPGAVGFNNHMGSAGTQNKRLMSILMSQAKEKGLFFIDSRSIANSVGEETARKIGVPHASRRIFLDNDLNGDSIRRQLDNLKAMALRDGEAIGIAHARPGVAQTIEAYLPEFARAGIELVHVSRLVHK